MPDQQQWQGFERGKTYSDLEAFVAGLVPGRPISISLKGDDWGPWACEIIATLPRGLDLRFLCLRGAPVRDLGMEGLAKAPALESVRCLCIERCGVSDAGLQHLLQSRCFEQLTTLCLCNRDGIESGPLNTIGDAGAIALASTPNLPRLVDLDLWNTRVGDPGCEAIVNAPRLRMLTTICMWSTRLTSDGAKKVNALAFERPKILGDDGPRAPYCSVHTDWDQRAITWTDDHS